MSAAAGSVLIVEDDGNACRGLAQLLQGAGFQVRTAADGVEALEVLDREPPDLMLLDVWMPRMDGLQVLNQLKTRPRRPRVIVMTADDTPETVLLTLRQDAYQFINKPIQLSGLLDLMHGTLTAERDLPPIVVLSARAGWLELLVPCARSVADRIESFVVGLETDLPEDVRRATGTAFRELLLDAMESDCNLNPNHKIRIACLRAQRMLMFRIAAAGSGFRAGDLAAARTAAPEDHARGNGHHPPNMLRPGLLLARDLADELLVNEARNEVVFIKYLD